MSFVGSIGTVIRNKGIGKVLKAAFGGSMKIFTGKKFPQNTSSLRMVVEGLLHSILQKLKAVMILSACWEKQLQRAEQQNLTRNFF